MADVVQKELASPAMMGAASSEAALLGIDEQFIRVIARPGPRYTSYPTAPVWTEAHGAAGYGEALQRANAAASDGPLSIYVHLPFCREMCRYCGCNVVVTARPEKIDRYIDYLGREMDLVLERLTQRRQVEQVHLGGGTPTWLNERQLERLWRVLSGRFAIAAGADLALEADPRVTTVGQLGLLRDLGFRRLSMGVQDFTPEVQQEIGRHQSVAQTETLFRFARSIGYETINFDLVYGLPRQELEAFSKTLAEVVRLRPDRIALFSYAHVPWMRPHQRGIDAELLPGPEAKLELFLRARRLLFEAGYVPIGMDHFALPDDELARARAAGSLHRNFQGYITKPSGDTLAFGVTAISDVQLHYAQNVKQIADYYRRIDARELPIERGWALSAEDALRRQVIHRLMCNFVVDLAHEAQSCGFPREFFAAELEALQAAEQLGLIERRGSVIACTPRGEIFVRNVAMVFDTYLAEQQQRQIFSSTV